MDVQPNDDGATAARILTSDDDVGRLQQLFEKLPSYCENTIGYPPGPAEAHSTLIARPSSCAPEDKMPVGVFDADEQLVGFSDVILRFPGAAQCYVGYVLVAPQCQRQGMGSYLLDYSARLAASRQSQCTHAVTGLIDTFGDEGRAFLEHCGYVATGIATPYEVNTISSTRREYVKTLR